MSRDLRHYARQTNRRLMIGFLLILFLVGIGSIWVIYGGKAALSGLICLLLGMAPVLLIGIALGGIDWLARHLDRG